MLTSQLSSLVTLKVNNTYSDYSAASGKMTVTMVKYSLAAGVFTVV